jgi:hypothetical protein
MAVGADENALECLLPIRRDRLASSHRDAERLGRRIHVVEMEVDHRPVVSADSTAAAGLLDEYPLDALVATGDRLTDATLASNSAVAVAVVFR